MIHARIYAQGVTLAALAGVAGLEYLYGGGAAPQVEADPAAYKPPASAAHLHSQHEANAKV